MARVRGHLSIYTKRVARKRYRCDGRHDTYAAYDKIEPGDTYWLASLPPNSEVGNTGWERQRLCFGCAPVELTVMEAQAHVA